MRIVMMIARMVWVAAVAFVGHRAEEGVRVVGSTIRAKDEREQHRIEPQRVELLKLG